MKIYLVGGAVRDELLGLPVKERDWVVVGATPEEMLVLGYKPVGNDFPVFLHPETHEEYALARTERKVGKGYKGFQFYADPSVSLEEDLKRRDLTINAIAKTPAGELIDPLHGRRDLKRRVLRHVSDAFAEDPVRILRVARFASRFGKFKVHPKTMALMKKMTRAGEVDALVAERVWQELERSLEQPYCYRFFMRLKECGALRKLFPEIAKHYRPALLALKRAIKGSVKNEVRFAALLSPLSDIEIKALCKRNKVPRSYQELALIVAQNKDIFKQGHCADPECLLTVIEKLDAFRRVTRFCSYLETCSLIMPRGAEKKWQRLLKAYKLAKNVAIEGILQQGLPGRKIKNELHKLRVLTIAREL